MQPWQPLITFWFGEETDDVTRAKRQAPLWWGKNSATDALLASRFGDLAAAAAAGELAHWADAAEGRLALILLLDQLPRNIHRGTPAAFAPGCQGAGSLPQGALFGGRSSATAAGAGLFLPAAGARRIPRAAGQKRDPVRGAGDRAGRWPGAGDLRRLCRLCPPPSGDRRAFWPLPPPQRHPGPPGHGRGGRLLAATGLGFLSLISDAHKKTGPRARFAWEWRGHAASASSSSFFW